MKRRLASTALLVASCVLGSGVQGPAEPITKTVGHLTVVADPTLAFPGGVLVVYLRRSLGTTFAILNGRRAPFLDGAHGPRAFVPIPIGTPPGPATLGIELWARRGRQRIAMQVPIAPRIYGSRTVLVPETKRPLVARREAVVDGRRLLMALRSTTVQALWSGPFVSPLANPPTVGFGDNETFVGGSRLNQMSDAIFGEYHRGLDYEVPAGTIVSAPAAATISFAGPLTLTGQTVVLDHGQGVVSAFFHLSRLDVREGDQVVARARLGLSGDTGIAATPLVHWGVYVHGVAVDPSVLLKLPD